jgi:DNA-directed RNA polymerase specialized sigma subunit
MDPTIDLLKYVTTKYAEQRKDELQLWKDWKESGHKPEKFKPLLKAYQPLLSSTTRQYSRSSAVPTEAVEADVHTHFLNACKTYKPDSGAQLSTWVHTHLQKTRRYVDTYSNIGKIPEPRIALINRFTTARDELQEKHDRIPTHQELVHHMNSMAPDKKPVTVKELKH